MKRELQCNLTDAEVRERGEELAAVTNQIKETEAEKKAANSEKNEAIKGLHGRASDLAECIRTGQETRLVEVRETLDYDAKVVEVHRVDTQELVERRTMSDLELQQEFFADPNAETAELPGQVDGFENVLPIDQEASEA
jgi:hypothetical protein